MSDSTPFFALEMQLFEKNNRTYMKHLDHFAQFRLEFVFNHDTQFQKSMQRPVSWLNQKLNLEADFLWASAAW